jgi:hypothetical protein
MSVGESACRQVNDTAYSVYFNSLPCYLCKFSLSSQQSKHLVAKIYLAECVYFLYVLEGLQTDWLSICMSLSLSYNLFNIKRLLQPRSLLCNPIR